jgi:hypothetical protein
MSTASSFKHLNAKRSKRAIETVSVASYREATVAQAPMAAAPEGGHPPRRGDGRIRGATPQPTEGNKMRRGMTAMMAFVLAFGMLTAPAFANGKGNSARSVSIPVELTADDLGASMCENGVDVRFYTVQHNLGSEVGAADDITFREPPRLGGQENVSVGDGTWDVLYLGVSGPECGDIQHKGQVTVDYFIGDDIYTIVAQFNGKGELLHVKGVKFEG